MWRILVYPFLGLLAVAAVPLWGIVLLAVGAVPVIEAGSRWRWVSRDRRSFRRIASLRLLTSMGGPRMDAATTCDVDSCDEPRMLALQRRVGEDWMDSGFCERHAFDIAAQQAVFAGRAAERPRARRVA